MTYDEMRVIVGDFVCQSVAAGAFVGKKAAAEQLLEAWNLVEEFASVGAAVDARRQMPIKVIGLKQTCHGCPMQWEGLTASGEFIYIRSRGHCFSVDLGGIGKDFNFVRMDTSKQELEIEDVVALTNGIFVFTNECLACLG